MRTSRERSGLWLPALSVAHRRHLERRPLTAWGGADDVELVGRGRRRPDRHAVDPHLDHDPGQVVGRVTRPRPGSPAADRLRRLQLAPWARIESRVTITLVGRRLASRHALRHRGDRVVALDERHQRLPRRAGDRRCHTAHVDRQRSAARDRPPDRDRLEARQSGLVRVGDRRPSAGGGRGRRLGRREASRCRPRHGPGR